MKPKHSHIRPKPSQIESWVAKHFDYKPRREGAELRINNPFDGDTGYHFNISLDKGAVNDWRGNGWVGINPRTGEPNKCTFLKFVQLYMGCSWAEAVKDVLGSSFDFRAYRNQIGHQKVLEAQEGKKKASLGLPSGSRELSESTDKIATGLKSWLDGRGVDSRKSSKYRIMYSGFEVIWPYFEYDELVYWQSRSRINKRFEFPPESIGVSKGQFLYGFDQVEPSSYLIITEAIFDTQTIEEQCVATGGASLTDTQVKKIKALNPRSGIILAPDNDLAGIQSILSNAKKLKGLMFPVSYSLPPEIAFGEDQVTKDWNELYEKAGWSCDRIRKGLEKNTRSLNVRAKLELMNEIDKLRNNSISQTI